VKARALLLVAALLWPAIGVTPAFAQEATLELVASRATVTYGEAVTLSGRISGDGGCTAGRTVTLEWRAAGSTAFTSVGLATTASDGTFAFGSSQAHSGRFRASAPQQGACVAAVSTEVPVRVRALVEASLVAGSAEAGDCVSVSTIVSPAKPGQTVELQHRRGAWQTREILTLDRRGAALARVCLGWEDVGVLRLRVRWAPPDGLNAVGTSPLLALEVAKAAWMRAIDEAVAGRSVSVSVGDDGLFLYRRADQVPRIPASNEKLLLAMALLDTFGPDARFRTRAAASSLRGSVVEGDLWILGRGDPRVGRATLAALARRIARAGITRVSGRVVGSTAFFRRDWDAPGWNGVARRYVNRPTALTFEGNHTSLPELDAARALTARLERLGVKVVGEPGSGVPPGGLTYLAAVRSPPLGRLLVPMLRRSDNFVAEVLGKRLGAQVLGAPGTIAKGAAALRAWTADRGEAFTLNDASGLSYDNRVTTAGIVRLLWQAEGSDWAEGLRGALPSGGQGTLRDRLPTVRLRAKTGTLTGVSALSGWVYVERLGSWVEFSILSSGMSKATAAALEDRIVRTLRAGIG
jgi:D-alanyl-D-alanine carboxypeptidase/D-alanyl-D-alanine-endopeptidase (penicillin-binding protein 4)